MSTTKTIVCLANSRMDKERCIAGLEVVKNKNGEWESTSTWIRPVSSEKRELSIDERSILPKPLPKKDTKEDKEEISLIPAGMAEMSAFFEWSRDAEPEYLDILEIPIVSHKGEKHQTENYEISGEPWKKLGTFPRERLKELCESPSLIWDNQSEDSREGINDRVGSDIPLDSSLMLIQPDAEGELGILTNFRHWGKARQVRAQFKFNGIPYKFVITDPGFESMVLHDTNIRVGDAPIAITEPVALCISLGLPFTDDKGREYSYKLVATIIGLENANFWPNEI